MVSVKPLHSLVQSVLGNTARAGLLIEGSATPHGYHMKPSQQRTVLHADVVFFIDENLETFLARSLLAADRQTLQIALADSAGIDLLKKREGDRWARHDHTTDANDTADDLDSAEVHAEHGYDRDLHIWLDPQNAIKMVEKISTVLSSRFPQQATAFADNASAVIEKLQTLDTALMQRLAGLEAHPFVVFHDAYGYFEKRYGLQDEGSILLDPQVAPSISQIRQVRERIAESQAVCIFSEPQFSASLVETVIEGTVVRQGVLDPLGADSDPGPTHYFETMRNLAQGFVDCLSDR